MQLLRYLLAGLLILQAPLVFADLASATGKTFYTKHSFKYEKNRYFTTNYLRGIPVPINSKATILDYNRKNIIIRLKNGNKIKIRNIQKFSQSTVEQIFERMFSAKPVSLKKFKKKTRTNIKNGYVTIGMSKKAVLLAIGYPPGHETPSTDLDRWKYWKNRFDTIIYRFNSKGKLSDIID